MGGGHINNAASLVTQTLRATSRHLSVNIFLLMQEHMQHGGGKQPFLYNLLWDSTLKTPRTLKKVQILQTREHQTVDTCASVGQLLKRGLTTRGMVGGVFFTTVDVSCTS